MAFREVITKMIWAQMAVDNMPTSTIVFFKSSFDLLTVGITPTQLSEVLDMTYCGAHRQLKRLEEHGYIKKIETFPFVYVIHDYDKIIRDRDFRNLLGLPEYRDNKNNRDVVGTPQRRGHTASISTVAKR